MGERVAAGL